MSATKRPPASILLIALLALAMLACQGAAGFHPFATDTPTPTNTSTPTPTFTVTPSPTVTQTPSATPRPTGIVIEQQADETSLVTDYDNRYQFVLPPKWVVVFATEKDLEEAIARQSQGNPEFAQMAEGFRDVDPTVFRLAALHADRGYLAVGFPPLLTVNAHESSVASSMPMEFVTAMIEDTTLQDATSTSWEVIENPGRVEVGIVRGSRTVDLPAQARVAMEVLVIAFQSNKKLILVEVAVPGDVADAFLPSLDPLMDSIRINLL